MRSARPMLEEAAPRTAAATASEWAAASRVSGEATSRAEAQEAWANGATGRCGLRHSSPRRKGRLVA
eukprot:scaffold74170_cov63-Phaeocystis_antarctica.AAC.5